MENLNEVKENDTGSEGKKDYRAKRDDETITDYECRRYGFSNTPEESTYATKTTAFLNSNTKECDFLGIEFRREQDGDEFCAGIDVNSYCHTCTCHKLAVVAYFQWDGSKYIQAPLMDSDPNTKYIILGQVSELNVVKR